MKPNRLIPTTLWGLLLSTAGTISLATPPPTGDPTTRGYVFTYFWFAMQESPEDCPDGYAMALRDVAIMDLPEAEQERLRSPEHRSEYYRKGYALGFQRVAQVGGESICEDKALAMFDDPPHRTVQGQYAFGKNLDGLESTADNPQATPDSCPQPDFISPDGATGIDNQLYRVMGCISSYRQDPVYSSGSFKDYHVGAYIDGEVTTLLEITGLDDPLNDDEVTVGVYTGVDPTPYDSQKQGLPHASITTTDNPLWRNTTQGKVVDGVLTTDPFDLRLKFGWAGREAEYHIKDTVIELALNEDGTAAGDLAGYFDKEAAYKHLFWDERGTLQVPYGFTCPAVAKALDEHADGYKDPETGNCTALSTAFAIEAVPAFVIHPEEILAEPVYPSDLPRNSLDHKAAERRNQSFLGDKIKDTSDN